jgi:hypothetical protein
LNFEVQKKRKKFRIYSEFRVFFAGKIHVAEGKAQEKGGFQKVLRRVEGQARQEEAPGQGESQVSKDLVPGRRTINPTIT